MNEKVPMVVVHTKKNMAIRKTVPKVRKKAWTYKAQESSLINFL